MQKRSDLRGKIAAIFGWHIFKAHFEQEPGFYGTKNVFDSSTC